MAGETSRSPWVFLQFGVQKLSSQDQASTPCDAPRFHRDKGSKEREQLFVDFKMGMENHKKLVKTTT